jgi:hypothetical protein
VMAAGDGAFAPRRPDPAEDRLQADPVCSATIWVI